MGESKRRQLINVSTVYLPCTKYFTRPIIVRASWNNHPLRIVSVASAQRALSVLSSSRTCLDRLNCRSSSASGDVYWRFMNVLLSYMTLTVFDLLNKYSFNHSNYDQMQCIPAFLILTQLT